jgi:hypothetical protein
VGVEFLRGTIRRSAAGRGVDVVISNCVINLAADKRARLPDRAVLRPPAASA